MNMLFYFTQLYSFQMSSIKQLEQTILNGMARDEVADLQLKSMIPTFINEL